MHILCPHCRNPIEVVNLTPCQEVACPSCGSSFRLEGDSTTAWDGRPGRRLGKFELLETLGHGAFGTVYKARDPELDRVVALKVPRAGNLAGPQELDRFLREARSAAQLRHPSIVAVHEAGTADGIPYLVSDFVSGVTLADLLSARRPGFREAAKLVAATADALQFAHQRGVVHRDVKPSNVMIGDDGVPQVMDFGLAKREAGEVTMTVEGQVLGTPAYMSPEQAGGESHKVDGRSDVYSLGVVLYQMLTGELPFRGTQRMLLHQVLHDEPRAPRSLNDQIPRDLETVCLKAMAREPARRYRTAGDFAADLRRWLRGEPVVARAVGATERAGRWCRRNPAVASLLGAVMATLLLGAAVSGYFAVAASRRAQAEEQARLSAQASAAEAREAQRRARQEADDKERQRRQADQERRRAQRLLFNAYVNGAASLVQSEPDRAREILGQARACGPDLCDFSWGLLDHWCRSHGRALEVPNGRVRPVAFSPDGKTLAGGGSDGSIQLWDTSSWHQRRALRGHTRELLSVCYSPAGDTLASAGVDGTIRLWTAVSGQQRFALEGHTGAVFSVAYSPNGETLASASEDGTIRLWRVGTGREVAVLRRHTGGVLAVGYSPDGKTLASGGRDGTVRLCDVASRQERASLKGHDGLVYSLHYSPDGKTLASGGIDDTARLWDVATGRERAVLAGKDVRHTVYVAFSPDGKTLASTHGPQPLVCLWDVRTGRERASYRGHGHLVHCVAFSPDGKTLASASRDGTVRLWAPRVGTEHASLETNKVPVFSVCFSPDGKDVAGACGKSGRPGEVKVWDAALGRERLTLRGHRGLVSAVAFSLDGKTLASASRPQQIGRDRPWGEIKLWEATTGRERATLKGHRHIIKALAFSPDNKTLASVSEDGTVILWDLATGQAAARLEGSDPQGASLSFSPDGKTLAVSRGNVVSLWDVASRRERATLRKHPGRVDSVCFSPDSTILASAEGVRGGTTLVWDARDGQGIATL